MPGPWTDWSHVLKVDPDKPLPDGVTYEDIRDTGTDAVLVGGTTGVTAEKMAASVDACTELDLPIYQEPSNPMNAVIDDNLDGYLVPLVLNAGDVFWITGAHMTWVAEGGVIDWERTSTEAYIILNPDASVAEYTDADCDLSAEQVSAYATVAEQLLGQEIVYVEYSGTLGDPSLVEAAAESLDSSTLFYGGGIRTYEDAHDMAAYADVIVVGDLLHDEGVEAVAETVRGAKDA